MLSKLALRQHVDLSYSAPGISFAAGVGESLACQVYDGFLQGYREVDDAWLCKTEMLPVEADRRKRRSSGAISTSK